MYYDASHESRSNQVVSYISQFFKESPDHITLIVFLYLAALFSVMVWCSWNLIMVFFPSSALSSSLAKKETQGFNKANKFFLKISTSWVFYVYPSLVQGHFDLRQVLILESPDFPLAMILFASIYSHFV